MGIPNSYKRILAVVVVGVCSSVVWPTQALAAALVRFVHGIPGVGRATVEVDNQDVGSIGFAEATGWHTIHSGTFKWTLVGANSKPLASGTATVGDGAYDIVVLEKAGAPWLGIYKAQGGRPGTSLVRVIHGAPELGSPELTIDGKEAVKSLGYTKATPYVAISPGTHTLAAMRPGDRTPLVQAVNVKLAPGLSYSGIVLGTRGQRVRVLALADRSGPGTESKPATGVKHHSAPSKPASGATPSARPRVIVVKPGDSLWSIASGLLGPRASNEAIEHELVAIWDLNAIRIGTGNPNLIYSGTRLRVPS